MTDFEHSEARAHHRQRLSSGLIGAYSQQPARKARVWMLLGPSVAVIVALAVATVIQGMESEATRGEHQDTGEALTSMAQEAPVASQRPKPSGATPSAENLSLEAPGAMRPDLVRKFSPPKRMVDPLASRLATSLASALEGDGEIAGELAQGLRSCRNYERQVSEAQGRISALQAMGGSEADVRTEEDRLLALVEQDPSRIYCSGISSDDYRLIDQLSEVAVRERNLGELPAFIAEGVSGERLRRYLADPAQRERFRSLAISSLERGVQSCNETSARILAQFHEEGVFAQQDPVLSLSYELMATWISGFPPERAPQLQGRLEGLSDDQVVRGLDYARRLYAANCM